MSLSAFSGLTSALKALINGALQRTENITGTIISRYGTTAQLSGVVPQVGELVINTDTNTLARGDGSTNGGLNFTPNYNTTSTIYLNPSAGTMAANGTALAAAYTAAKALLPFGNALSATNRATLVILPGWYDIRSLGADITLDGEFVDIVGIGGQPGAVVIWSGGTSSRALNQTANDVLLKGFTVFRSGSNNVAFKMGGTTHALTVHEDLVFAQDSGVNTSSAFMSYATFTNFDGTYRRIRCMPAGSVITVYGGFATGITCNAVFIDCVDFGPRSLGMGQSNTANYIPFTGRQHCCRIVPGNSAVAGLLVPYNGATIERGYYKSGQINQSLFKVVVAGGVSGVPGPIFRFNTIIGNGTADAIEKTGAETTAVLTAHHNAMSPTGIDAALTNNLGNDAAAFNIVNANIG